MKLAVLGGLTAALGVALSAPGLVAVGALWAVLGPVMKRYGRTLVEQPGRSERPDVDGRTFARGTALWLLLGVPSLLVGVQELGIPEEHADWRWLPIVVGGLALGIGVVSGLLYVLGSAASAVADRSPRATVPATIWIRSVQETGTFINERPRLRLQLRVEPARESGLEPYEVTKLATVPYTALGSLRVGGGFAAHVVGPEDPTTMDIGWDQPRSGHDSPASTGDVSLRLEELDRLHRAGQVTEEEYRAQRERILGSL